jgi:hypothetical protein
MTTLVLGLGLFLLALAAQLAVWRVRLPRRQTRAILAIFGAVLAAGLLAVRLWPGLCGPLDPPAGAAGLLHVALLYFSLLGSYVISYSALEADSPTLLMVRMIDRAGAEGIAREAFLQGMNDELLVLPRLADLLRDRMAVLAGGRYRLTAKGRFMARLFTTYRRLLGAGLGG